jgi:hypothetical protein
MNETNANHKEFKTWHKIAIWVIVLFFIFVIYQWNKETIDPQQELAMKNFVEVHNYDWMSMECIEWDCKNILTIITDSEYDWVSSEDICRGIVMQVYDIQKRVTMTCRHNWESVSCSKLSSSAPSCI